MPDQHEVDPATFRCRRCGRGLLSIQFEPCVAAAPPGGTAAVPRQALDWINRGWKPTA